MVGKFHIGTSGWSYKDWVNIFYPKNLKSDDWLAYYAKTFDCTEINSSFYRLPSKQTVTSWLSKVPREFLFCPKMSRYLTHMKKLQQPEEPVQRFFSIFEPMKKQLGPVLVQLPKLIPFNYERTEHFYALLKEKYASFRFAMEVRNPTWMTEASYKLMTKYKIAFVISHSGDHFPYAEVITTKNIYFRFHGPSSLYDSKYNRKTLKAYAELFAKWLRKGHDLWIFFNNDWFGYGIENALTLKGLLEKFTRQVPVDSGSENYRAPR